MSATVPEQIVIEPAVRASVLRRRLSFLAVFGPGLLVMLADTDVGSVITAGQSGVQWGYRLLPLQLALIPVLYMVQELTVRLGVFTGRGHGELIREHLGPVWAWISAAGLAVASVGALLTEFSGVAGVGEMFGVPRAFTLPLAVTLLLAIAFTGSYRRVERAAIAIGLFEFAFFAVAVAARPDLGSMVRQSVSLPIGNDDFRYLIAANIGAVVMPWMIFYQQSAVADKKLGVADYRAARWDTALGAVVTQLVMIAVLVAAAATIAPNAAGAHLDTIGQMSQALTPFLGQSVGRVIFGLGVLGAGLVAAIVTSLALAWGLGEVAGYRRSLEYQPRRAPWFYGVYVFCVVGGATAVAFAPDLVSLNVGVQVMNALMLPLVLGFLIWLAVVALPPAVRLRGWYLALVLAVSVLTCAFGLVGGLAQ
jgi:Mn2+/Fe2+ NRAMP family transporter